MCSIAGVLRFDDVGHASEPPSPLVERLRHRGPDGEVRYRSPDGACELSLCRLAIVRPDLPARAARDGALVAVSAGELYDYAARGGDGVDTDLVPALYRESGVAFVRSLRGPLTSAIYDEEERTLVLVRDAVGKRPLYFARRGGGVVFASEMKALLAPDEPLDPRYVSDILAWGVSRRPPFTAVEELRPGDALLVDARGRCELRRVDRLGDGADDRVRDGDESSFAALFDEAVALRVPPHVSAAVAVGGMDSLLVAHRARLPALTLAGHDEETAHARARAAELGLSHEEVALPAPSFTALRRALWHLETVDDAACWQMAPAALALAERTRALGHRVLLLGEGADELFLAYPWHPRPRVPDVVFAKGRALALSAAWQERLRAARARALHDVLASPVALTHDDTVRSLAGVAVDDHALSGGDDDVGAAGDDDVRRTQREGLLVDMHLLPVLHADRLYFAHGVETRAPFLDRHVIDLALGLSARALAASDEKKPLVSALYRERFGRPAPRKRGFSALARPPVDAILGRARDWLERGPRAVDRAALAAVVGGAPREPGLGELAWRAVLLEELVDVMRGAEP